MHIRARYDVSDRVIQPIGGPSLTQQHFKDETDVNQLVERFRRTGDPKVLQLREGFYADVTHIGSYQDALHTIRDAELQFAQLSEAAQKELGDVAGLLDAIVEGDVAYLSALGIVLPGSESYDEPSPLPGEPSQD